MMSTSQITQRFVGIKRRLHAYLRNATAWIQQSKLFVAVGNSRFADNNMYALGEKYFIERDGLFEKNSKYAIIIHLFYTENWQEVFVEKFRLLAKSIEFDLYVTMPEANRSFIPVIRKYFFNASVLIVPNKGRDVLPFIKTALLLDDMGYEKVLKIHSKKSTHRDNKGNTAESGDSWLNNVLDALIPNDKKTMKLLIKQLKNERVAMIGPSEYYYPVKMYLKSNIRLIRRILSNVENSPFDGSMASSNLDELGFFGGTMFWVSLNSIREALYISSSNFPNESGQTDGTTAHALERVFCVLPQIKDKSIYGVTPEGLAAVTSGVYPKWYFDDISGGRPRISVVVPVYADWSSLSVNIKSLKKYYTNSEEVAVYYINDCGPDADALEARIIEQISGLVNFYYFRNERNLGFVKTCNRAAFEITPQTDDVLLLNSDTKVTKDFAIIMKQSLYSEENIGAVTARSNNATIWSIPMTSRLAYHRLSSYALYRLIKRSLPRKYITPTIHGFCVLIQRTVIKRYGLFDEVYGRGYGEENDFAMRIRKHGWKSAVANKAFVFHYESRSFGNAERDRQIEKNEKILLDRYPDYRTLVQEYWDSIKEPLK